MDVYLGRVPEVRRAISREGTWTVSGLASDRALLLREYRSFTRERVWYLAGRRATPLGSEDARMTLARFGPRERHVYFASDEGSEFVQLRRLALASGERVVLSDPLNETVEAITVLPAHDAVVFSTDHEGRSRLCALVGDSI